MNLKNRPAPFLNVVALATIIAALFWSIQVRAYPPHQGEYLFLSQMPEPARVLADTKGENSWDTAARQHAALDLLATLADVAVDGKGQTSSPPREQGLKEAYLGARPDGDGHRDAMLTESYRLQADTNFVQTVLNRYFSAAAVREIEPLIPDFVADARERLPHVQTPAKEAPPVVGRQPAADQQGHSGVRNMIVIASEYANAILILCAIIGIPMVMWLTRLFRALIPLRMTSDDPPQFKGGFRNYEVHAFTGIVGGSASMSATSVSGSVHTIAGNPSLGIPSRVEGSVTSTTVVTGSFRLVDPVTRKEANFALADFDLQLWQGQLASVAWAVRGDKRTYLVVVNHTSDQVFGQKKLENVRRIYTRPSGLWTFLLAICLCFPPTWIIIIPWGILVEIQIKRYWRSGIQPLLKALNQKAEALSQQRGSR